MSGSQTCASTWMTRYSGAAARLTTLSGFAGGVLTVWSVCPLQAAPVQSEGPPRSRGRGFDGTKKHATGACRVPFRHAGAVGYVRTCEPACDTSFGVEDRHCLRHWRGGGSSAAGALPPKHLRQANPPGMNTPLTRRRFSTVFQLWQHIALRNSARASLKKFTLSSEKVWCMGWCFSDHSHSVAVHVAACLDRVAWICRTMLVGSVWRQATGGCLKMSLLAAALWIRSIGKKSPRCRQSWIMV